MGACAGVDWASDKHDVLIADETGRQLLAATFAHTEAGIARLCRALADHGVDRVAVERPDGLLVERLLDAGLMVLAIHPNQVAAARPRFRPAGGKSDAFDSFVIIRDSGTPCRYSIAMNQVLPYWPNDITWQTFLWTSLLARSASSRNIVTK